MPSATPESHAPYLSEHDRVITEYPSVMPRPLMVPERRRHQRRMPPLGTLAWVPELGLRAWVTEMSRSGMGLEWINPPGVLPNEFLLELYLADLDLRLQHLSCRVVHERLASTGMGGHRHRRLAGLEIMDLDRRQRRSLDRWLQKARPMPSR